jgi:transcriptional regulator with XRE-family HTH domain
MSKPDVDVHVGKRLRLRRTMMGLSQEALAKAVGVTFQQVQKYEKGVNAMNASRLYEFSQHMHVPISYFFEGLGQQELAEMPAAGFAESPAAFDHGKNVSDRESLEMMKAFKRIKELAVRKRLSDLVRAIADNRTFLS